ncbi:hypothetical protein [Jatrophihabitans fulvus]
MSRVSWFARVTAVVAFVGVLVIVAAPFVAGVVLFGHKVGAGETAVIGIALLVGFGAVTVLELRHGTSDDARLQ